MPSDDRQTVGFEHRRGNALAFLSSLVFHVTLLLVLALCVYTAGKKSQGLLLSADIGESQATSLDMMQSFELSPPSAEPMTAELAEPDFKMDLDIDGLMEKPQGDDLPAVGATLTSLSVGKVISELRAPSNGRGANFFGAYAEGNRFVYVLDSSRSMTGDRWTYACAQLIDSLNGLRKGQGFFVICFDMQTSFLFNTPPQQAKFFEVDKDTVVRVKNWLRSRTLGRATMPGQALQFALDMNPDAIFLLSDGELQDNSLMMLRMLNGFSSERRQIPVHTVHLFSLQGRQTLEMIALENSGSFTPIEAHRSFGAFNRR